MLSAVTDGGVPLEAVSGLNGKLGELEAKLRQLLGYID